MIFEELSRLEQLQDFRSILSGFSSRDEFQFVRGLSGSARSFFMAGLVRCSTRPWLAVLPTAESAEDFYDDLSVFAADESRLQFFPARGIIAPGLNLSNDILRQRLTCMLRLVYDANPVVVTCAEALGESLMPVEKFRSNSFKFRVNQAINFDKFVSNLVAAGFERTGRVEIPGEMSVRGGIVDVFPFTEEYPLRIELDDEKIISIRRINRDTQLSTEFLPMVSFAPAKDVTDDSRAVLPDYLKESTVIFFDEPSGMESVYQKLTVRFRVLFHSGIGEFGPGMTMKNATVRHMNVASPSRFTDQWQRFVESVSGLPGDYRVILFCNNDGEKQRVQELISESGLTSGENFRLKIGSVSNGFVWDELKLVVLTNQEIFGRYRGKAVSSRGRAWIQQYERESVRISDLLELSSGDYVVHADYGIGCYRGMECLAIEGNQKDFIHLEYAGGDKLYVPVDKIRLIQKYIGNESPPLHHLGTVAWEKTKARIKKSVQKMAEQLLRLYAARKVRTGVGFGADTTWQNEFENAFIYEETADQSETIREVKKDMESDEPMDRLVCGDVGYGKTEVAMRAAFKTVMDGFQAAVLAPTTVLVQQHLFTFRERMADYPLKIEALSRLQAGAEQKKTLSGLTDGSVDIVIGTHRLLQKDVRFRKLALLIVDEEQRFGVAAKEKIKQIKETVDVLTLTATPIPRTLHFSLSGLRKISMINTPPEGRRPVETFIVPYSDELIKNAIQREINREGQVFYLHNRIETIQSAVNRITRVLPCARTGVAHGSLPSRELEKVMLDFINRKFEVLVTTSIIESGLDLPNVNTLIVEDSDKFGLAQLYQLRGRVGRSRKQAYAFLTYSPYRSLTETARLRLKAIEECAELGSGFRLALRDLEIRGAGNLLGNEQHGHMEAVGFELYCQLLDQAIVEMKGEQKIIVEEPAVELSISAYLPDDFVPDSGQKIEIYRKMADLIAEGIKARDAQEFRVWFKKEIGSLRQMLKDRYGGFPVEVENLIKIVELKIFAAQSGIRSIRETENIDIEFNDMDSLAKIAAKVKAGEFYLSAEEKPVMHIRKTDSAIKVTQYLIMEAMP